MNQPTSWARSRARRLWRVTERGTVTVMAEAGGTFKSLLYGPGGKLLATRGGHETEQACADDFDAWLGSRTPSRPPPEFLAARTGEASAGTPGAGETTIRRPGRG